MVRTTKIFVALVLMVAGCGSPPSTPKSAASSGPTEQASVPSAASTTTLPGGSPAQGSLPVQAGEVRMAAGPNRDLYVLISTPQTLRNGPASRTVLALLDSTGKPRTGWPIALDGWSCENPSGDPP